MDLNIVVTLLCSGNLVILRTVPYTASTVDRRIIVQTVKEVFAPLEEACLDMREERRGDMQVQVGTPTTPVKSVYTGVVVD